MMLNKLLTYLKYEEQLLLELNNLAEKQQFALVKFQMDELEQIVKYQEEVANNLKLAEDQRMHLLMSYFRISKREAMELSLSKIEEYFSNEEKVEINKVKAKLKRLLSDLSDKNLANKVLTNRARHSIREIINVFTNGNNNVYSVRV